MNILFFGDSITWGAWDEEGGWVNRIKKFVDKKIIASDFEYYHDIYNVGVSGNKTTELLTRFESEAKSRIDEDNETLFIFSVGVNDSKVIEDGSNRTSIKQFRRNLKDLITQARKMANQIIFVGIFPVDDSKAQDEGKFYRLEHVERYNCTIKEVCEEEKLDFIDIYNKFVHKDYKNLLIDGLHPNTEGHREISEIVLRFLVDKKYI